MPLVYYIGGPADLTKRRHAEQLYHHDYIRFPLARPLMWGYPHPAVSGNQRYSNYRLQKIGPDTFVGVYDKDSE